MPAIGVTGQFIRRGREGQDHTELLLAQLQDAREAEAAAVALAEVLTLLAAGLSNAEIGQRLYVSNGTVKTHSPALRAVPGD